MATADALFGLPDGAISAFEELSDGLVEFPATFGGIGHDPGDARVRVVVGQLGTGKSLHLRRMQDETRNGNDSVYADDVQLNTELMSEDLAAFASRLQVRGNTEYWKLLWRRCIFRSTASHLLTQDKFRSALTVDTLANLRKRSDLLGDRDNPRNPMQEARDVIHEHRTPSTIRKFLTDGRWVDVEADLTAALRTSPAVFMYLDHLDNNYRWAPSLWRDCQRGLFYAVMDLLREDVLRNKLHVIITIRDVTYASIRTSEHAPRYLDSTHINLMSWNVKSLTRLLTEKISRLPDEYFVDARMKSVDSWLGRATVKNSRLTPSREAVLPYLLRHTRLVPRDLIVMGNRICDFLRQDGHEALTSARLREIVSECSADSAHSQLAQAANQVLSDRMPNDAVPNDYDHVYLRPNEFVEHDASAKIVECIEATQNEVLDRDALAGLDEMAAHLFNSPVRLADVCWQNGLLGVLTQPGPAPKARFFSIMNQAAVGGRVPSSPSGKYVWHPTLFDVAPGLRSSLPIPIEP